MVEPVLLRRADVLVLTTLSNSSIISLVRQGRFPRPVQLSPRRVAWKADDVAAWIAARASGHDAQKTGNSR